MTATTAFAATAAGHTTSTYTPFTNHWTTYLTLSEDEKPAFFEFISQVARAESSRPQDLSEDAQDFSNSTLRNTIFTLAQKIAQNPNDPVPPAALDRILEAGVPVDICGAEDQMTAFHCTLDIQDNPHDIDTASVLLDKGAFIDARDKNNFTLLSLTTGPCQRIDLAKYLVGRGANVNNVDLRDNTPLSRLISADSINIGIVDLYSVEITGLLASHPDIDWSLPGNSEKPIAILQHRIESAEDEERKAHLRAMLSLIQTPLIAHLQAQNAALLHQLQSAGQVPDPVTYASPRQP